jgi:hypothetical protein
LDTPACTAPIDSSPQASAIRDFLFATTNLIEGVPQKSP